jgi:hypothetical protein
MSRHRAARRRPASTAHPAAAISSELGLRRDLVAPLGMWAECPRTICRRARVCRSPVVACFAENPDTVRDLTREWMVEACRLLEFSRDEMLDLAEEVDAVDEAPDTADAGDADGIPPWAEPLRPWTPGAGRGGSSDPSRR